VGSRNFSKLVFLIEFRYFMPVGGERQGGGKMRYNCHMKTKPLTFLLSLTFLFLFSCAANLNSTTVSSIAIAPVELGSSVHILLPDAMIESKKVQEYLRNELNKLGFSKGEYD
ncbi:uncharacterized protein METZ01_LOCUS506303, partial [marine metagenome]